MDKRYCGKCGKLLSECTCDKSRSAPYGTTVIGGARSPMESPIRSGRKYTERFNGIALSNGERVIRIYNIGRMTPILGKGDSYIVITNRRVISKVNTSYCGSTTNSIDELTIDTISGTKSYFTKGFTIWRILLGVIALVFFIIAISLGGNRYGPSTIQTITSIVSALIVIWMALTCQKPSYLFNVYATTTSPALSLSVNMRGKLLNSNGNGLVFQFKPTKESIDMMNEIGACILDLKTNGDYAIENWLRKPS